MDNKRLILALVLSVGLFFGWNLLAVHMGWVKPAQEHTAQAPTAQTGEPGQSIAPVAETAARPAFKPTAGRTVTVETPLYKAVFHSQGGVLQEFTLKNYRQTSKDDAPMNLISPEAAKETPMALQIAGINTATGGEWALEGDNLTLEESGKGTLRFIGQVEGIQISREFTFEGNNYTIGETLRINSPVTRDLRLALTVGAAPMDIGDYSAVTTKIWNLITGSRTEDGENQYNLTRVAWFQDQSFSEENSQKDLAEGKEIKNYLSWTGVMNNYFLLAVSLPEAKDTSMFAKFRNGVFLTSLTKPGLMAEAGKEVVLEPLYYFGPKDTNAISSAPNNLSKALHYGFFTIIAKPLLMLLDFFYKYVHNYGAAIILMTIVIKILFWPLSQKSYKSMEAMKKLQPEMQRIREKYANDKEAMNKEVMQLYKIHKVNPAGGCLPILVQIPVFFGLYQALLNATELRHAAFAEFLPFTSIPWITDLSAKDPTFILPIVMGASMFIQQKMAPPAADPTHTKIMMMMPFVFTFIFLNFPSGLVIYWLVNNVISIGQQWLMRRSTTAKA